MSTYEVGGNMVLLFLSYPTCSVQSHRAPHILPWTGILGSIPWPSFTSVPGLQRCFGYSSAKIAHVTTLNPIFLYCQEVKTVVGGRVWWSIHWRSINPVATVTFIIPERSIVANFMFFAASSAFLPLLMLDRSWNIRYTPEMPTKTPSHSSYCPQDSNSNTFRQTTSASWGTCMLTIRGETGVWRVFVTPNSDMRLVRSWRQLWDLRDLWRRKGLLGRLMRELVGRSLWCEATNCKLGLSDGSLMGYQVHCFS